MTACSRLREGVVCGAPARYSVVGRCWGTPLHGGPGSDMPVCASCAAEIRAGLPCVHCGAATEVDLVETLGVGI